MTIITADSSIEKAAQLTAVGLANKMVGWIKNGSENNTANIVIPISDNLLPWIRCWIQTFPLENIYIINRKPTGTVTKRIQKHRKIYMQGKNEKGELSLKKWDGE